MSKVNLHDSLFKDECVLTHAKAQGPGGLCVNLSRRYAIHPDWIPSLIPRVLSPDDVYLRIQTTRIPREMDDQDSDEPPSKLGIGVPGGFRSEFRETSTYMVETYSEKGVLTSRPLEEVEDELKAVCLSIIDHPGTTGCTPWELEDVRPISRYAENLVQVADPPQISTNPEDWKCAVSGEISNLWLNLSDGFIGGGRSNFMGTGGSNGAVDHYADCLKAGLNYPLAVKLGTITADSADMNSYAADEDCMVSNPFLERYLNHFGLSRFQMTKSDKTMTELDVANNKMFSEWANHITEGDKELTPMTTLKGYTNCGNSCYINALLQVFFLIPEFREDMADPHMIHRLNTGKLLPNFAVECHKVYEGLQTPVSESVDVQSFRRLIGQGHPDFGTAGQQDVVEYLTFLLTKFEDHEFTRHLPQVFQIGLEECLTKEGQDTFKKSVSPILSLPPPAIGGSSTSFDSCLAQVFGQTLIDGTNYLSQTRVRSFPAYLFVQISRYALEGGQVRKVVERLEVPAHLNLEAFRATPKEESAYASREEFTTPPFLYNAEMLSDIQNMGFSKTAGEKALKAVNNANLEAATEWILANMEDPTLNDEIPGAGPVDTSTLEAMGFSQAHAEVALKACKFQVEAALEFLFGKSPEELEKLITQSTAEPELSDGPAQYQLVGFISHIGNHPATGHYVAHCMKEVKGTPKWVQFNDEKVYLSQEPPTDAGYLYLFQRKTL